MASEKALYWIALGVAALFLGNHFAQRYDGGCLAKRSFAAVQELSAEASQLMASAGLVLDRSSLPLVDAESEVARVQSQFASMDAAIAREQSVCARVQAQQARRMALREVQHLRLETVCPRQALRLQVPAARPDSTL